MSDAKEKITLSQTMANDALAEVSAMINQKDVSPERLEKLQKRLRELFDTLNDIETGGAEF